MFFERFSHFYGCVLEKNIIFAWIFTSFGFRPCTNGNESTNSGSGVKKDVNHPYRLINIPFYYIGQLPKILQKNIV